MDSEINIIRKLSDQAEHDEVRLTQHAHQEMVEDRVSYQEIKEVLVDATLLENYPKHRRGPCCLICGETSKQRYLHIVSSTAREVAIIITVYEPKQPKWITPFERGPLS